MHQQEQSETKLIAVLLCHHLQLSFRFSIHTTLVVIHIVCVCGESDVGTFKSCLGYCCLSIREENEGLRQGSGSQTSLPLLLSQFSQFSISASAGLAVIANRNKTWPQCVFECTFKYFNYLWHLIYFRHLNWP